MPETDAGPSASALAGGEAAASGSGSEGVAGTGNAPGTGQAGGAELAQGQPSPTQAAAEFLFGGRKYRDQKHAEDSVRALFGKVPSVQRENAHLQAQLSEMQEEMSALRAMARAQGGQGKPDKGSPAEQKAFADELVESGELEFITQLAEEKGIGHAVYALAQVQEKKLQAAIQQLREEAIQPIVFQNEVQNTMTRVMGTARELAQYFPELDDNNSSPEAQQAQSEILEIIGRYPPEFLKENPEMVIAGATLLWREANGIPTFGKEPGSSGSPSAFAAQAAEAAQGSMPLDGPGVPHPGNGRENPQDRIRKANKAAQAMVKSEGGRNLFRVD